MKKDQQHLEFLISQYVDNTLDPPNRKLVEQQVVGSPEARQLHRQHREVQDLLDDLGSRIPLIDWAGFEGQLAARLENETPVAQRTRAVRRWLRPLAAAAALFLAAAVGYAWHAWTQPSTSGPPTVVVRYSPAPTNTVQLVDVPAPRGSSQMVRYPDAPRALNQAAVEVTLTPGEGFPSGSPTPHGPTTAASSAVAGSTTQPDTDNLH